jgi:hypothetical protein
MQKRTSHIIVLCEVCGRNSSYKKQESQQQQERRYHQCNKGCGQEIYFDANSKTQNGKFIPLDIANILSSGVPLIRRRLGEIHVSLSW